MSRFFDKFINSLRSLFSLKEEEFRLPLDESNKLIHPMGSVKKIAHTFRTRSTQDGRISTPPPLSEVYPLDDESDALLAIAKAVRDKAYANYSGFQVGAALVAASGQMYLGVNIENAAYPAGICAERSAFCAAISAGEREFTAIAIMGSDENEPCYPCGICRQFMSEFCPPEFPVILADGVHSLGGLMPCAFSLEDKT
ncbi:MAG: cytidine deaminase [Oscillospiraceae bacterium]|nr:cytidine deaminase [Oscillospiraceae bacterium]